MSATATQLNAEGIVPAVHLEFIQNQLENPHDSGSQEIEQYHRALFLHHHAVEWEKHRQEAKVHEDRLLFLEGQLKNTDAALNEHKRLGPGVFSGEEGTKASPPGNGWAILEVAAPCRGGVCPSNLAGWRI